MITFSTDAQRYEIYEHSASTSRDYVVLFGRHHNREGVVMRGRGTLQECRRITDRRCRARCATQEASRRSSPNRARRMATGWDIVWCDGRKMGVDATDDPELCDVAARLHDAATRPDRPRGETSAAAEASGARGARRASRR